MKQLLEKIKTRQAHVGVIGIGYVGLPLAVEFAKAGFKVTALDKDQQKIELLNNGESYIPDVPTSEVAPLVHARKLSATADPKAIAQMDAIIVCVPTPLNKTKDPDVSYILDAADAIAAHAQEPVLVVLESTTYPGTTREVVAPRLTARGLEIGKTAFLAFSPERVDPGNQTWQTHNTPKVIGGMTPECLQVAKHLYEQAIETLVPVSSTDAAEMVKLLENTFRAVNIGLVNEVALMCEKLELDTWEVIDAARSKPFGFMPFYPGPGLGGHCIPIDPLYLSWKLRSLRYTARFIELADEINSSMPSVTVQRIQRALNQDGKAVNGAKILILGVAYKANISDVRESPALDVISLLLHDGAEVDYHDPFVPEVHEHGLSLKNLANPDYSIYDCVAILTHHRVFDIPNIVRSSKLIVDTRNATQSIPSETRGPGASAIGAPNHKPRKPASGARIVKL
jgi:UDP-N-acetyl-D-glucosamine dehydrogenase